MTKNASLQNTTTADSRIPVNKKSKNVTCTVCKATEDDITEAKMLQSKWENSKAQSWLPCAWFSDPTEHLQATDPKHLNI